MTNYLVYDSEGNYIGETPDYEVAKSAALEDNGSFVEEDDNIVDIQPDPEWPDDSYEETLLLHQDDFTCPGCGAHVDDCFCHSEADYWDGDDSHNE